MARINLLPWRAELRKQKKQAFLTVTGLAIALMAAVVGAAHIVMQGHIDFQKRKNQRIEQEIAIFNGMISQIAELQRQKEGLVKRMDIIEALQRHRPEVVHLFDELVMRIPDGLYLNKLVQKETQLTLEGIAQSNARVSAFMRALENSDWFKDPNLEVIRANTKGVDRSRQFTLVVQQVSPHATAQTEEK